jgi:hypothetical protein
MAFCPLEDISSQRLRDFAEYLESKRATPGGVVDRAALDPIVEVPRLVSRMLLVERVRPGQPDAGRIRVRLVGTELAAVANRDLTGQWLDEVALMGTRPWPFQNLEIIFAGPDLFAGASSLPWEERAHVTIEWVAQRLASPPDTDELVIFAFDKRRSPYDE